MLNHKPFQVVKPILKQKTKMEVSHSLTSDYTMKLRKQNRMVLAHKQIHKSMERKREPRNTHTHLINCVTK